MDGDLAGDLSASPLEEEVKLRNDANDLVTVAMDLVPHRMQFIMSDKSSERRKR
jgi:hypothetical protein